MMTSTQREQACLYRCVMIDVVDVCVCVCVLLETPDAPHAHNPRKG